MYMNHIILIVLQQHNQHFLPLFHVFISLFHHQIISAAVCWTLIDTGIHVMLWWYSLSITLPYINDMSHLRPITDSKGITANFKKLKISWRQSVDITLLYQFRRTDNYGYDSFANLTSETISWRCHLVRQCHLNHLFLWQPYLCAMLCRRVVLFTFEMLSSHGHIGAWQLNKSLVWKCCNMHKRIWCWKRSRMIINTHKMFGQQNIRINTLTGR